MERLEEKERTVRMLKVDDAYLSLGFSKLVEGLSRSAYMTLVQLHLGHFPTASYLYQFNLTDTPRCLHCLERAETTEHYLMNCTAHRAQRQVRDLALGAVSRSMKALLTPGRATEHLLNFIYAMGGEECRSVTGFEGWERCRSRVEGTNTASGAITEHSRLGRWRYRQAANNHWVVRQQGGV